MAESSFYDDELVRSTFQEQYILFWQTGDHYRGSHNSQLVEEQHRGSQSRQKGEHYQGSQNHRQTGEYHGHRGSQQSRQKLGEHHRGSQKRQTGEHRNYQGSQSSRLQKVEDHQGSEQTKQKGEHHRGSQKRQTSGEHHRGSQISTKGEDHRQRREHHHQGSNRQKGEHYQQNEQAYNLPQFPSGMCSTQVTSHYSSIKPPPRLVQPSGLINIGNTCYMNSILQCLYHTEPLREYYLENQYTDFTGKIISQKLQVLFKAMKHNHTYIYNDVDQAVEELKKAIEDTSSLFQGHRQRDAQEFLTFILDQLHEEDNEIKDKPYVVMEVEDAENKKDDMEIADIWWKKHLMRNKSKIVDIFHGQNRSLTTCSQDSSHQELMFEPISQLAIPVPQRNSLLSDCLLDQIFSANPEQLWFCEKCNNLVQYDRKVELWSVPQILIIYLKRFNSNRWGGLKKNNQAVYFPSSLDMNDYIAENSSQKAASSGTDVEQPLYQLYGVISHRGDLTFGHYAAYVKMKSKDTADRWYYCSDDYVTEVSQESVLKTTRDTYILFYEKMQASTSLHSQQGENTDGKKEKVTSTSTTVK